MLNLKEELIKALDFNKEWQQAIEQREIPDDDYAHVFSLILFLPSLTDPQDARYENFQRLCCSCLILHLATKPLNQALKELNEVVNDLFINVGIDPEEQNAKSLKKSIKNLAISVNHTLEPHLHQYLHPGLAL